MRRRGHSRPPGTVWRMRLTWHGGGEPMLDDLVEEDPFELERGFLVVGVEEPSREGGRWVVLLERLDWLDYLARMAFEDSRAWSFVRDR